MGYEVKSFENLGAFTNSLSQSPVDSGLIIFRVDVDGGVLSWRLHDELQVAIEEVLEKHKGDV
ncbi:MAG: hypothetical protein ACTSPB_00565 [Candidatus Thorarchaeota archaeon]